MELPVSSFDGINIFTILPDAILLRAIDPNDEATYRYETHASGAGTLLVQYGYTDVKHSNAFVRAFVRRQPMMEHGLALSAQLMFVSAMRAEAERRARLTNMPAARPVPAGFGVMLDHLKQRGQVARIGQGRRVQVEDRVYALKSAVLDAISRVADYAGFVPGVDRAAPRAATIAGAIAFYLEMSTPLVGWSTTYEMRALGSAGYDGAGVGGDLSGARFRWLVSDSRGTPPSTNVSYTVQEELARSSFVLRQLFKFQPSLECGIEVALALVWMRAIRARAEHWR
jgi:hypothetical protein